MFENILWAEVAEKGVEVADKISLASVEAVLKNLDRLATFGMWFIGIVIGIAAIAVGYNIVVSERTVGKLKKDFKADMDLMKKTFDDQIRETRLFASSAQDALYAAIAEAFNLFEEAALRHARAGIGLIEIKKFVKVSSYDENLKKCIMGCKNNLENAARSDTLVSVNTIQEIKEFVPLIPDLLSDERVKIEQILNELEKMAQKKRR